MYTCYDKNSALILAKHALSEVIKIASILLFFKEFCLADQQLQIRLIALPNKCNDREDWNLNNS